MLSNQAPRRSVAVVAIDQEHHSSPMLNSDGSRISAMFAVGTNLHAFQRYLSRDVGRLNMYVSGVGGMG